MIFDAQGLLSDAQAITASAASTNSIDLGATGTPYGASAALVRDIGLGDEVELAISVTATFNNLTSLSVAIEVDDNSAFSSPRTVAKSGEIALAALIAGYQFKFPACFEAGTNERYVRLYYTITGTAPSTGKITGGVVAGRQTNFVGGQ